MIRRPPRSTRQVSSAASDVYKRQILDDVLAELDLTRQNLLLNSVGKDSQCFISATHLDKFNQSFLGSSQMIHL